ncbi:MAG TPA: hypothetical protein DCY02_03965 [Armatimonadetes bacterium]|nr:hypothetical protein [Armatimonadota bacterium]
MDLLEEVGILRRLQHLAQLPRPHVAQVLAIRHDQEERRPRRVEAHELVEVLAQRIHHELIRRIHALVHLGFGQSDFLAQRLQAFLALHRGLVLGVHHQIVELPELALGFGHGKQRSGVRARLVTRNRLGSVLDAQAHFAAVAGNQFFDHGRRQPARRAVHVHVLDDGDLGILVTLHPSSGRNVESLLRFRNTGNASPRRRGLACIHIEHDK